MSQKQSCAMTNSSHTVVNYQTIRCLCTWFTETNRVQCGFEKEDWVNRLKWPKSMACTSSMGRIAIRPCRLHAVVCRLFVCEINGDAMSTGSFSTTTKTQRACPGRPARDPGRTLPISDHPSPCWVVPLASPLLTLSPRPRLDLASPSLTPTLEPHQLAAMPPRSNNIRDWDSSRGPFDAWFNRTAEEALSGSSPGLTHHSVVPHHQAEDSPGPASHRVEADDNADINDSALLA